MNDNYLDSGPAARRQLTEQAFAVLRRLRHHASEVAGDVGLSFLQARALWRLEQPVPTGELAEGLGLDRSNVTSVVDRLEERGLVARRPHPDDRRVKLIALTEAGRATRAALDERLHATVTVFDSLTEAEQRQLGALLAKVLEERTPAATASR